MKKKIKVYSKNGYIDKEINHIPLRYILAILIALIEIVAIIGIVVFLSIHVPYFYTALLFTQVVSIITIVVSSGNPDYKLIWLFFVVMLPLVGLMLYLIFHKRKLPKRMVKRLKRVSDSYDYDDSENINKLQQVDELMLSQARSICCTSNVHLYTSTKLNYYTLGEQMHQAILNDIKKAEKFIFLEYFIIEDGVFWKDILDILIDKAQQGVEVKLVYDDVGCMTTLPGNYYKTLTKKYNIQTVLFSKLRGRADAEFNNRSHRKLLIIDGQVGFTGGINIADEYINVKNRFGHWKDGGIRVEGKAVNELTKLFLSDYYINIKKDENIDFDKYYIAKDGAGTSNFIVPFGDGPKPVYEHSVGKTAIMNLLNHAKQYVYITTPYLIVDNELMSAIENTAMRGVKVKIVVPHIPDKKLVFGMTKSSCYKLINSGVEIYEYLPGFIHSKLYIADDNVGIVGTMNLDYRSLAHHFENGVWIYDNAVVGEIKQDILQTIDKSQCINGIKPKDNIFTRLINILIRLFAPLL